MFRKFELMVRKLIIVDSKDRHGVIFNIIRQIEGYFRSADKEHQYM